MTLGMIKTTEAFTTIKLALAAGAAGAVIVVVVEAAATTTTAVIARGAEKCKFLC